MQSTLEWLVAQWTSRFSEVVMTMGDVQPKMQVGHMADFASDGDLLWWEQPFSCAPESPLWIGASDESWAEIGKIVLMAAGLESSPASEIQSTYFEIIKQSMGGLAQDIGQRISTQVTSENGMEGPPQPVARHDFRIEVEFPAKTVTLHLVIADAMCGTLSSALSPGTGIVESRTAYDRSGQSSEPAAPLGSRTFELLLDVELPLSVSFGRTALKLQDAMKLITGSLIELDRSISDPVELLVNNCVIARGEVVVVEGNYGVRITEIISQQERLQQSRRYMLQ